MKDEKSETAKDTGSRLKTFTCVSTLSVLNHMVLVMFGLQHGKFAFVKNSTEYFIVLGKDLRRSTFEDLARRSVHGDSLARGRIFSPQVTLKDTQRKEALT